MDLTIPANVSAELAAAFFQAGVTIALAALCAFFYRKYRKPYFGYWALAWVLYALRMAAILSFMVSEARHWLYWHQVFTGWTALALLWAALVFSRQVAWRPWVLLLVLFPPVWSYLAIYRLEDFLLAAGPAVLFLSFATLWTGWVFYRYFRQVGSVPAAHLAVVFLFWAVHHLDYPFLRARGIWVPWGYYLDLAFELAMGAGILLLVQDDLYRGLKVLTDLTGDLQTGAREGDLLGTLLERPLSLPGVAGTAIYLRESGQGSFARGAGVCRDWGGKEPWGSTAKAVSRVLEAGKPKMVRDWKDPETSSAPHAFAAVLPVAQGDLVRGALVVIGEARDPFTALDDSFLVALGRQVGAALENADLYQALKERTGELEHLAVRMVRQTEEERRRLSRELHDETAQVLAAVRLQLGVLREHADDEMAPRVDRAIELLGEGIQSVRSVTSSLRPSLLDDLGLVPALRALVDDFGDQGQIETNFSVGGSPPSLSKEGELALFRALQEGLSNAARHANAGQLWVTLTTESDRAVLRIRDDGQGLSGARASGEGGDQVGTGLAGMRERISALGGSILVTESPGGGVELVVAVPGSETSPAMGSDGTLEEA